MSDLRYHILQERVNTKEELYDVAILGGGMAGLTLALQLKQRRSATRILVIEKQQHPVPEAAHKVDESTVEIAAYYLQDVLGLQEHLQTQQLRKFGLRMFFSTVDNQDISRRVEYGQIAQAPLSTYQLDRGRLENALGRELPRQGIAFLDGCKVQEIALHPQSDVHRLYIQQDGYERELQARWVVDASGRSSLLKRQLGLAKKVSHHANAVWFRVGYPIDIDTWSTDHDWLARITEGERALSTNHLMGPGYWVWLIPLASGSTSVGIVTDARMHAFEQMNRFERALAWLHEHEPQCAEVVEQHRAAVQDFRVMKDYAYSCEQVYSHERWCLTGEAAVAIDPLYSSGGDLIAIGNGLTCDVIGRDLDGEDIAERAASHSQLFLIFAEVWLVAYDGQYPLMGNAKVMVAKVIWDTVIYWAFPGLLYFHDKIRSLSDSPTTFVNLYRCWNLHTRVQAFFREWHVIDQPAAHDTFADPYSLLDFLVDLHTGMAAGLPDAELEAQFAKNARLLEQLAGQLVSTVIEELIERREDEAIQSQIQRWQTEPFLTELMEIYQEEHKVNPIDSSWITLGHQDRERQEVAG
ncbi:MAG: tryptophan 7-halogenase [Ktedonobacteraceae bacterium]|nr:tryptophan 7-halogenase [Ktedonobacteraceae bacterium]